MNKFLGQRSLVQSLLVKAISRKGIILCEDFMLELLQNQRSGKICLIYLNFLEYSIRTNNSKIAIDNHIITINFNLNLIALIVF